MRHKVLLYTGVISISAAILFIGYGISMTHYYQPRAWSIESVVTKFIVENEGRFPESQQELIDKGYIKIDNTSEIPRYLFTVELNGKTEWRERPVELHQFTISYGATKEDLYVMDNKLYSSRSKEQVFLLDGPYNRTIEPSLRRTYRLISLKWYEQMK